MSVRALALYQAEVLSLRGPHCCPTTCSLSSGQAGPRPGLWTPSHGREAFWAQTLPSLPQKGFSCCRRSLGSLAVGLPWQDPRP